MGSVVVALRLWRSGSVVAVLDCSWSTACGIFLDEGLNLCLFSKFLVEFICEAVWTWAFVCWKISDYSFNFRARDGPVKIFYLFLVEFWKVVLFLEVVHFFHVVHFIGI